MYNKYRRLACASFSDQAKRVTTRVINQIAYDDDDDTRTQL